MDHQPYTANEIPPMLDVPSLAAFLDIGKNTAYDLVRSGQVQALRIGKKIRIPRHAVLQYLGVSIQQ